MTLKVYQQEVVDEFNKWYRLLKKHRRNYEKIKSEMSSSNLSNNAKKAVLESSKTDLKKIWRKYKKNDNEVYHNRVGPNEEPIPHVCIMAPTGGGKTRMAGAILKAIGKPHGLVLWIVPSKAIMEQTVSILKDKEHPVRRMLDIVSGDGVEILKKDDVVSIDKLANGLCVIPLMVQGTNRTDKEFLKIYRDSGANAEFFPPVDDKIAQDVFQKKYSGLEMNAATNMPRFSLVNVFRMYRPTIILDESHKVPSKNFGKWAESINQLGPGLVVELSATPNERESNILRKVTGSELRAESMIKKRVVVNTSKSNWKGVLDQAVTRLKKLECDARRYADNYIRPIMIIRVELTDPKLHKPNNRVHAFDARDYLVEILGIPPEHVAIKSAVTDELKGKNLMKRSSVRYIITKNALMEGWDCPFAYMLVILDNLTSQRALTQLLGRILRQPYIKYTNVDSLDNCYVYCISEDVHTVIQMIQKQLNKEGFTDMRNYTQHQDSPAKRTNKRRSKYSSLTIRLPTVLHKDGQGWSDIDYNRHILYRIKWKHIVVKRPIKMGRLGHDTEAQIDIVTGKSEFSSKNIGSKKPKLSRWTAVVSELVPNAWQAARIIKQFWKHTGLKDDVIYTNEDYLQETLLDELKNRIIEKSSDIFKDGIENKIIRFDVQTSGTAFKMNGEYTILPDDGDLLKTRDAKEVQLSLFRPIYKEDFDSEPERSFAKYLDEAKAIEWWHRVAARGQGEYYLRGWQKHRIYPDFIALFNNDNQRVLRIYEIKGRHLDNDDTKYKKSVLKTLENAFNAGMLSVQDGSIKGEFRILFTDEIERYKNKNPRGEKVRAQNFP